MSGLQALLFDCDGVLVDTERDGHRVAFNQAFRALGLDQEWTVDRYGELLEVAGGKERMRSHFDQTGWPDVADKDAFILNAHRLKTELFMEIVLSGDMRLRPGVKSLISEALESGIKVAVCSTSNVKAVQGIVDHMIGEPLAPRIQVFAGDMVKAKKPDPAIYQLGIDTLALDPDRCLVIEDSNVGLRAAKAAGIRCIVTTSSFTQNEDFELAERVMEDLQSGGIDIGVCRALVA